MADRNEKIPADHIFLFKPIEGCDREGCSVYIWLPKEPKSGSVLLAIGIHGGAFSGGDAVDISWNHNHYFLENGIAVASLQYRLAPHVTQDKCHEDCLDGYVYIQQQLNAALKKAGAVVTIDTERCLVGGGSAGGTASLMLAADVEAHNAAGKSPRLPRLKAVLAAYPLTDANNPRDISRAAFEEKMAKDQPEDWELMQQAYKEKVSVGWSFDPAGNPRTSRIPRMVLSRNAMLNSGLNSILWGQEPPFPPHCSVINRLSSSFPPTFILAAENDKSIPVEQSTNLFEKLKALGVEVDLRMAKGAPHAFDELSSALWPEGCDWWETVVLPALEFGRAKLLA